jgi:hypothetical protein
MGGVGAAEGAYDRAASVASSYVGNSFLSMILVAVVPLN